ncbi:hypothetical protein DYQ86_05445 [Acidobacteria bacterium AB60]|nr:hypothetical protein DYQ86_05445 [Acidobacteria bacterium AB60]
MPYPRVYRLQRELLEACQELSQGEPATLLLHVSGYGFSRDGAPTELATAIARVREHGEFKIAVYFHELFATGMPWRSAFWHSRRQQRAVSRIAQDADVVVTNVERHAAWLEEVPDKRTKLPVWKLPVISNVGESQSLTGMESRMPTLAVFGLPASRRKSYGHLGSLARLVRALGVREVFDIGPPFDAPAHVHGVPVKQLGVVPAGELGNLLSRIRFGFATTPAPYLAKSGVFAGYCAHGTIPVIADPFVGTFDGLSDGLQLISPKTVEAAGAGGFDRCSTAAWTWYRQHSVDAHAETYARVLGQLWASAEASAVSSVAGA